MQFPKLEVEFGAFCRILLEDLFFPQPGSRHVKHAVAVRLPISIGQVGSGFDVNEVMSPKVGTLGRVPAK